MSLVGARLAPSTMRLQRTRSGTGVLTAVAPVSKHAAHFVNILRPTPGLPGHDLKYCALATFLIAAIIVRSCASCDGKCS